MTFDPAAASRDRDRAHRPVDLDPPPRRHRTHQVGPDTLARGRPTRDFRAACEARGLFRGEEWGRMSARRRRMLAREITFVFLVEVAGMSGREAAGLLGVSHRARVEILAKWRGRAREIAAPGEDD